MRRFRVVVAPEAADIIRSLHPGLKRSVRGALDALADDPSLGEPLRAELEGLRRYRVRRFRIVYALDATARVVQVVAVGPRRTIYDDLAKGRPRPGRR